MNEIKGLFDLSTLDIENIKLSDIPDYTVENFVEFKELRKKLDENKESMTDEDNNRIQELQFLRAADFHRDQALDDKFPEYDEKHATIALQDYARSLLLK